MPQGYAWIFPMAKNQLKVGVIRYFQDQQIIPHEPSYKFYLQQLLNQCGSYKILDKHGKTISYAKRQKDCRSKGPVIAIGDAISSVNPLGWEGIRHAMASGRLAAQAIHDYLRGKTNHFASYEKGMSHYFGYKWLWSEWMTSYLFKTKSDSRIDRAVRSFGLMNNKQIMRVIFDYQFKHALKSFFCYFFRR